LLKDVSGLKAGNLHKSLRVRVSDSDDCKGNEKGELMLTGV